MRNVEVLKWPFSNESIDQIDKNEDFLNYPVIYMGTQKPISERPFILRSE